MKINEKVCSYLIQLLREQKVSGLTSKEFELYTKELVSPKHA